MPGILLSAFLVPEHLVAAPRVVCSFVGLIINEP